MTRPHRAARRSFPATITATATALLLLLGGGCAYFNTFYNAREYYRQAMDGLGQPAGIEAGNALPATRREQFQRAIDKSLEVIDEFPGSRFINEALFIIGRSHFYRAEYGLAERYLKQVLAESPWWNRAPEVRVWLARTHAGMGLADLVEIDLAPLLSGQKVSRAVLAEVYALRGDLAVGADDVESAIEAFNQAARLATEDGRRSGHYYRLYELLSEAGRLEGALQAIDQYRRYAPSQKDRRQAVLTRIQLLQDMDRLKEAFNAVRAMLDLAEFANVVPGLQLALAKIELGQGNISAATDQLINILEEFATLPEASEAAYMLGEMQLTLAHDIEAAIDYYRQVKTATPYFQRANGRLGVLEQLDELAAELRELEAGDSTATADPGDEGLDPPGAESGAAALVTANTAGRMAAIHYRLGEIALFEMADTVRALETMAQIFSSFEATPAAPQAVYMLWQLTPPESGQNDFWKTVLLEKYPRSIYARTAGSQTAPPEKPAADSLAGLADLAVQQNPAEALRLFRQIRDSFGSEHATFAIAYLQDIYLADLDAAIAAYEEHLDRFPEGGYSAQSRERLNALQQIKASLAQEISPPAAANP